MIPKEILQMTNEKPYDFRKRIDEIHKSNLRDYSLKAKDSEFEFTDISFEYDKSLGDVVNNAVLDFEDYMSKSMGVKKGNEPNVFLKLSDDLGEYNSYKGYRITVTDKVEICGYDERGIAQALYNLEDVLSLRRAPFIKKDIYYRKPMYSPQMVHSGYGFAMYPDSYLSRLAHDGRDAIMIFVKDINKTLNGYLDFNDVINRAKRYGIDVYAYSTIKGKLGPTEDGAEEFYESTYGKLFDSCPGIKGIIMCGESIEFLSKDPHVSGSSWMDNYVDGIPTGKVSPGWYPCCDYPDWLRMIQKIVYKRNPDCDIILWSYNWAGAPEDARVALIKALPDGVTMQATFETGTNFKLDTTVGHVADYTLSCAGPSDYFISEAKASKERGVKFYSMTNTGGATWDFGIIPYIPAPQQWQKRYHGMEKYHYECGLSGLNECHHYGMYPSFISKLSKWTFTEPRIDDDELLTNIIKLEFGDETEKIKQATQYFSEGITYFTPTDSDQYGAFRIGTAYPFCLDGDRETTLQFDQSAVLKGKSICYLDYIDFEKGLGGSLVGLRLPEEIKSLEKMRDYFKKGIDILDSIENKNDNLLFLTNQCHFMYHIIITGINAKVWYDLKCKARAERDRKVLKNIINEMEALLISERKNAEDSIVYATKDSRLGYEPSMEYIGDEWHIRWKLRQIDYVLNSDLAKWKNAVEY